MPFNLEQMSCLTTNSITFYFSVSNASVRNVLVGSLKAPVSNRTGQNWFCVSGVVSCENQYPPASGRQDEYLSSGPMCRYAEDLLPMLHIMSGPNATK